MTLTRSPLRTALAFVLRDAIEERQPSRRGCCENGMPCGDHAADQAQADAMKVVLTAIEDAPDDEAALEALRNIPADVLAEVTGTTWDEELRAAITSGNENGPQISPAGRAECASADDTPTNQGVHQS